MTQLTDLLNQHAPRPGELSLVTSTLGASSTWYAHHMLAERVRNGDSVVFVSFTHDVAFHIEALKKIGLDVSAPAYTGKCCIIDGLSTLFLAPSTSGTVKSPNGISVPVVSMSQGLDGISKVIKMAVGNLSTTGGRHLILSHAELLLSGGGVLATALLNELMDWHSLVSSTTMFVAADSALVTNGRSRMEIEHATFLLNLAHEASSTLSFRMLDTGLAKDVSGVLRLTDKRYGIRHENGLGQGDKELLYYVKDNAVQVFGRGEHPS